MEKKLKIYLMNGHKMYIYRQTKKIMRIDGKNCFKKLFKIA